MKRVITVGLSALLVFALVGCSSTVIMETEKAYDSIALSAEVPTIYDDGSFMVDVTNPAEIVGWGDYVFVARVESELRTEYTNLRQNEDGTITGKPYTVYSITVLENIKGELRKNEPIEFFKHGGVNYDGLSISLLEGDQLLESRKTYILIAASEADGRLGQGMPNSSIELDLSQRQSYSTKSEYSSYCEYVRDEVECERTRYHSMYENSSESRIDE